MKEENVGGRRRRNTPKGVNLKPDDTMEMTCKADRALPSPTISWYLGASNQVDFNSQKFKGSFELIDENGPSSTGATFSSSQTVRYTARREDHQISIYCEANQVDDESNEERTPSSQWFTLNVDQVISFFCILFRDLRQSACEGMLYIEVFRFCPHRFLNIALPFKISFTFRFR